MTKRNIGVRQREAEDCGAACLATVLNYHKLKVPLRQIREKMKTNVNGVSIYGIIQTAGFYNMQADAYEVESWNQVKEEVDEEKIDFPIIAHTITNKGLAHYIVILGYYKNKLKVFDPAKGYIKQEIEDFEDNWSQIILSLRKKEAFVKANLHKGKVKKYIDIIISLRKWLIGIFMLALCISAISVAGNFIYQYIIDSIISEKIETNFGTGSMQGELLAFVLYNKNYIFLILMCLYILQSVMSYIKNRATAYFSKRISRNLIKPFYEKIISLPISYFHGRKTGSIISRFQDLEDTQQFFANDFLAGILNIIMAALGAFVLFYINGVLFGLVVIIVIIYIVIMIVFYQPVMEVSADIVEQSSLVLSAFKEDVDGIDMLKSYNMETRFKQELIDKSYRLVDLEYKGGLLVNRISVLVDITEQIGILISLFMGMLFVYKGLLTLGQLIVFENLVYFFVSPIKNLVNLQLSFQKLIISINRIDDVLEMPSENQESNGLIINVPDSNICLENVNFSYGYGSYVLTNINLSIKGGEKVVVIGRSGSGKSTLLHLINGFQYVDEGKVCIGGIDIQKVETSVLRKLVLYVPQDITLFSGTLRDNLCINQNVGKEEFQKIIVGCAIDDIIKSTPHGLDTVLQENGKNLSGGQRQRIAVAQALLQKPKVLIFDESTNQLDSDTEMQIIDFICNNYVDCTIIFATHNKLIRAKCNRVIEIESGKLK